VRIGREVEVALQLGGLSAIRSEAILVDAGVDGHRRRLLARAEVGTRVPRLHHPVVLVVRAQKRLRRRKVQVRG